MENEDEKMLAYLKALGVPPMKNVEEFKSFMTQYGTQTPKGPEPVKVKAQTFVPRISIFFGEAGKGEVSYETWAYEVKCLIAEKTYTDEVLLQAIRRSLRGHAADKLRYLGVKPSVLSILENFSTTYGMVETPESILRKFYACKQEPSETVLNYGIRIEDIHAQAVELGALDMSGGMLKRVFYRGLSAQLKHLSAFKFETVSDYNKFKKEVRMIENELLDDTTNEIPTKPETQKAKCHSINKKEDSESSEIGKQLKDLTALMEKMNTRIEQIENRKEVSPHQQQQSEIEQPLPIYQQQLQNPQQQIYTGTQMPMQQQPSETQNNQYGFNPYQPQQQFGTYRPYGWRGPKHFRGPRSFRPRGQGPFRGQGRGSNSYRVRTPIAGNTFMPECWACHQRGHLARDCPSNF